MTNLDILAFGGRNSFALLSGYSPWNLPGNLSGNLGALVPYDISALLNLFLTVVGLEYPPTLLYWSWNTLLTWNILGHSLALLPGYISTFIYILYTLYLPRYWSTGLPSYLTALLGGNLLTGLTRYFAAVLGCILLTSRAARGAGYWKVWKSWDINNRGLRSSIGIINLSLLPENIANRTSIAVIIILGSSEVLSLTFSFIHSLTFFLGYSSAGILVYGLTFGILNNHFINIIFSILNFSLLFT